MERVLWLAFDLCTWDPSLGLALPCFSASFQSWDPCLQMAFPDWGLPCALPGSRPTAPSFPARPLSSCPDSAPGAGGAYSLHYLAQSWHSWKVS